MVRVSIKPSCFILKVRFSRGSKRGLWAKILLSLQEEEGIVKVRRQGTDKKGRQSKGKRWAGISTKFQAVITGGGRLVGGLLTGGEVPDVKVAAEMFHVKLLPHCVHYISDCFYGLSIDKHVFIDNSESPETAYGSYSTHSIIERLTPPTGRTWRTSDTEWLVVSE